MVRGHFYGCFVSFFIWGGHQDDSGPDFLGSIFGTISFLIDSFGVAILMGTSCFRVTILFFFIYSKGWKGVISVELTTLLIAPFHPLGKNYGSTICTRTRIIKSLRDVT